MELVVTKERIAYFSMLGDSKGGWVLFLNLELNSTIRPLDPELLNPKSLNTKSLNLKSLNS